MAPQANSVAGPSHKSRQYVPEDRRDKKHKDLAGRLGKEMAERRDEQSAPNARFYSEPISFLQQVVYQLATHPETSDAYNLRLYPLSLERSALLVQLAGEEAYAREGIDAAHADEAARVRAEFDRGAARIRDRLLEGIEDRRKRAREERDADGAVGDAALDHNARGHPARKLRNKLAASPPPPILPYPAAPSAHAPAATATSAPAAHPLSLAVDELPSPFPLPLVSPTPAAPGNGAPRRRGKGVQREPAGALGRSRDALVPARDSEVDADLGEIRRGNKRRRAAMAKAGIER